MLKPINEKEIKSSRNRERNYDEIQSSKEADASKN